MKELLVRTGTSILFVGVLVGAIISHSWASAILFFLFMMLACHEYFRMMSIQGSGTPTKASGYLTGLLSYSALLSYAFWGDTLILKALPLLFPLIIFWEFPQKSKDPFLKAAVSLFGPLFFGFAFGALSLIREHPEGGPYLLLGVLILVWVHDSAAYLMGKLLGKRKLWPRISPGKSWEGSISGALFCLLTSWLLAYLLPSWGMQEMPLLLRISLPLSVIFLGTLGDLSISLLKRSVGVKDTGRILPGHGGVLDRFDALMMSTPAFFLLLELAS